MLSIEYGKDNNSMHIVLSGYISSMVLGQLREFKNMGVVTMFNHRDEGPDPREVCGSPIPLQQKSTTSIQVFTSGPTSRIGWSQKLEPYLLKFQPVPGQKGLLVTINGEIVGLEMLSNEQVYRDLHPRFVRTYAMAALVQDGGWRDGEFHDKAWSFFRAAAECQEQRYRYDGCGFVHRLEGPGVSGAALVTGNCVIQLSLFATSPSTTIMIPNQPQALEV